MDFESISNYIEVELGAGRSVDNKQLRKICEAKSIDFDYYIRDIKEAIEIALMHVARNISNDGSLTIRQRYDKIISLYENQPYVGVRRTLDQLVKQQYSTALPVAFLMSQFVRHFTTTDVWYFEPSAGNGFLTVALPQEKTIVNEIDKFRLENLKRERYHKVLEQDGRRPFDSLYNKFFHGVVTNPPFLKGGETDEMIFNALATMSDSGRCAILRDEWSQFKNVTATVQHRAKLIPFYERLFTEYNVVKIINLDSRAVYAKQGTAFYMQIILIDGRRPKKVFDPAWRVFNPDIDKTKPAGFEELWEYFSPYFNEPAVQPKKESPIMQWYHEMKDKHPNTIFLLRVGDFYEAYSGDAVIVSKILGITLTKTKDGLMMAGFPKTALDTYLPKLVNAGQRTAVIEERVRRTTLFEKEINLMWKNITQADVATITDWGYREDDLPQIDEVAGLATYRIAKMPQDEDDIDKFERLAKKTTMAEASKLIGRKEVLSGIGRLAFHGWSGSVFRGNSKYTLELYMPKSYWA